MNIEDYKTGMRVVYANGEVGIVFTEFGIVALGSGYNLLEAPLSDVDRAGWNITAVHTAPQSYSNLLHLEKKGPKIWSSLTGAIQKKRELLAVQIEEVAGQLEALKLLDVELSTELGRARGL